MSPTPLSGLQQFILALAEFHRVNTERDTGQHPLLYAYEVLGVRWGFPTKDGTQLQVWTKRTSQRPQLPKARLGKRYQAARVAVSKAFRRLEQRGLVQQRRYGSGHSEYYLGLVLTTAGIAVARQAFAQRSPQWEEQYWRAMDHAVTRG
ncbi:MAG: hypothetical protein HYZ81_23450 [Nitrospinae bacterium]|nr:hypothetical protein [Nitrospinota bacterium]